MDDQSKEQPQPETQTASKRSGLPVWFLCAVCILFLYVLSIGPAAYLAAKRCISFGTISAVYSPILRLCDACQPAHWCLNWYLMKVSHVMIAFVNHETIFVPTDPAPSSGKPST